MDLIRWILFSVERDDPTLEHPSHGDAAILDHLELLVEAGFLLGEVDPPEAGDARAARIRRLTWAGHDFLDAARDDRLWSVVRRTVMAEGRSWTLEGLKLVLFDLARQGMQGL